jgi:hypothetical protein
MGYNKKIKIVLLGIILTIGASAGARAATCGEASCAPAQGAYISHFTGPNCDGSESYYLPYDGGAYQCRTGDGGGQCGTIHRTVTNRSYFYNGTCYSNAWPSGNTLSDFVAVYRDTPGDGDLDGIPDSLELALAQQFFPVLNLHCGTFEGLELADRRQLYGLPVPGYSDSSNGRIPFVAHAYLPGNRADCAESFQCIEIRYGMAWNWDLGDDVFGDAHSGDSEVYSILVARKDTDGADWGTTWDVAKNDVSQWRLIKEFMSAHWTADHGDSSSYRSQGNYGSTAYQKVWCAEGKHAMYPSQSACNDGGWFSADDCSDNRCDIVTEVFTKVQNVGEPNLWLNPYIVAPSYAKDVSPYGTYNVWSGDPFGTSTDYRSNLTLPLNWCPASCY